MPEGHRNVRIVHLGFSVLCDFFSFFTEAILQFFTAKKFGCHRGPLLRNLSKTFCSEKFVLEKENRIFTRNFDFRYSVKNRFLCFGVTYLVVFRSCGYKIPTIFSALSDFF